MSRLSNYSVSLSSDYRVGELFIDCKSRCPVCQTIQSVYRLAVGWENYLSTVRVGVPFVWLLSRLGLGLGLGLESELGLGR